MRTIPGRRNLAVAVLALVGVVTIAASRWETQTEEFHGWIVRQEGDVHEYQKNEWDIEPGMAWFRLNKANSSDYVKYYGTFSVVELRQAKLPEPRGDIEPLSWKVTQEGISHVYCKNDGWVESIHENGINLEKRKIRVWYYGDFHLEYRDR